MGISRQARARRSAGFYGSLKIWVKRAPAAPPTPPTPPKTPPPKTDRTTGETPPRFPYTSPGGTRHEGFVFQSGEKGTAVVGGKPCGRGGFGTIFTAYTREGPIALKIPSETTPESTARLVQEMKNGQHSNSRAAIKGIVSLPGNKVAGVLAAFNGSADELTKARILRKLARKNTRIAKAFMDALYINLLQELTTIHREGHIHKDLKPHNILWNKDGMAIADFDFAGPPDLPGTTKKKGTFAYMPPEAFESRWTHASGDLWSLGMTLLEIATDMPLPLKDPHALNGVHPKTHGFRAYAESHTALIGQLEKLRADYANNMSPEELQTNHSTNPWHPVLCCFKERVSKNLFLHTIHFLLNPDPTQRSTAKNLWDAHEEDIDFDDCLELYTEVLEHMAQQKPLDPDEEALKRDAPPSVRRRNGWDSAAAEHCGAGTATAGSALGGMPPTE